MTQLNFGKDVQGYNAYAPSPSTNMLSATIASTANATITLPSSFPFWIVVFSFTPGSSVWVSYNGNAAIPAGSTFAASTSELNPGARILPSFQRNGITPTTINLLNNGTGNADVWVGLYALTQ
jgi:hypothetical protein